MPWWFLLKLHHLLQAKSLDCTRPDTFWSSSIAAAFWYLWIPLKSTDAPHIRILFKPFLANQISIFVPHLKLSTSYTPPYPPCCFLVCLICFTGSPLLLILALPSTKPPHLKASITRPTRRSVRERQASWALWCLARWWSENCASTRSLPWPCSLSSYSWAIAGGTIWVPSPQLFFVVFPVLWVLLKRGYDDLAPASQALALTSLIQ